MNLTYVAPYVPYLGIRHAGGQYFYEFLSRVAAHHDVHLIAPGTTANRVDDSLWPAGVSVHLTRISTLTEWRPLARFLYGLDVLYGMTPGLAVMRSLKRGPILRELVASADIVEVQWSQCLPIVPILRRISPNTTLTAVTHDVYTQSLNRRAANATSRRVRVLSRLSLVRARRLEPSLLNRVDAVFAFSEKDLAVLRDLGVKTPSSVIDPYFAMPSDPLGPSREPELLFVGALDRIENTDAIVWLLDQVWPAVQAAVPAAHITIAGASPPEHLLQRAESTISVTGFLPDLDPTYRSARLVVAPSFSGAGVKFKVLQAMAYGLPVVTTPIGAEGIVEHAGLAAFGAISESASETAAAIISLLSEDSPAQGIGQRAREWVSGAYNFDASVARVLAVYERLGHGG